MALSDGIITYHFHHETVLAGTKSPVMGLWEVPDQQTQELMGDFYQRILKGQSRASSLREAQLALKKRGLQLYYWGAFICQGDSGALLPEPAAAPHTDL